MRTGKLIKTTDAGLLKFTNMDAVAGNALADVLGVEHRNLIRVINKAIKHEKDRLAMRSELSALLYENCLNPQRKVETEFRIAEQKGLNFNAVFKEWEYVDSRGRTQSTFIMNSDALYLAISYLNYTPRVHEAKVMFKAALNDLQSERHIRNVSRDKSKRYTDELMILQEGLFEEGSKGAVGVIATMQRKIYNQATGRTLPRGGVNHEVLSGKEDFLIAKLRNGVADVLENTMHLTAREARKAAYDYIKNFKETV